MYIVSFQTTGTFDHRGSLVLPQRRSLNSIIVVALLKSESKWSIHTMAAAACRHLPLDIRSVNIVRRAYHVEIRASMTNSVYGRLYDLVNVVAGLQAPMILNLAYTFTVFCTTACSA